MSWWVGRDGERSHKGVLTEAIAGHDPTHAIANGIPTSLLLKKIPSGKIPISQRLYARHPNQKVTRTIRGFFRNDRTTTHKNAACPARIVYGLPFDRRQFHCRCTLHHGGPAGTEINAGTDKHRQLHGCMSCRTDQLSSKLWSGPTPVPLGL